MTDEAQYTDQLSREARHWGARLQVERVERHAWLDHPLVREHYRERGLIDGQPWEAWSASHRGAPAAVSLELGCGSAGRSLDLLARNLSSRIEGVDVSPERVAEGQRQLAARAAQGDLRVGDVNAIRLPSDRYDLIFSCHSFHHFQALEHVMDEVSRALTADGLFILEEFVGPTQFQWTDAQIALVRDLTALIPERYRRLRWGAVKPYEGRPTPEEVMAVSPFESIRSAEIVPLFRERFEVVAVRRLGGTLQHLLHNGIIHNFEDDDPEACAYVRAVWEVEDALIDAALLPSDFQLLVGRRR
jgi:SAM-dependent methyltransferase